MQPHPSFAAAVPRGPVAYRREVRRWGAAMALPLPALLGLAAIAALAGSTSSVRGGAGFLCAVLAAPGLLVAGAPLAAGSTAVAIGAVLSAVLWGVLGTIAARRATRSPAADWHDYWREFLWLAGGVWVGVLVALVAVDVVLGRPFV